MNGVESGLTVNRGVGALSVAGNVRRVQMVIKKSADFVSLHSSLEDVMHNFVLIVAESRQ